MESTQRLECTQLIELEDIDELPGDCVGLVQVAKLSIDGVEHSIWNKVNTIGRAADCDVVIDNEAVSSKHAVIEANTRGRHEITDLGSTNKTRIGREILPPRVPKFIENGATLKIANVHAVYIHLPCNVVFPPNRAERTPDRACDLLKIPASPEVKDDEKVAEISVIAETPENRSEVGILQADLISDDDLFGAGLDASIACKLDRSDGVLNSSKLTRAEQNPASATCEPKYSLTFDVPPSDRAGGQVLDSSNEDSQDIVAGSQPFFSSNAKSEVENIYDAETEPIEGFTNLSELTAPNLPPGWDNIDDSLGALNEKMDAIDTLIKINSPQVTPVKEKNVESGEAGKVVSESRECFEGDVSFSALETPKSKVSEEKFSKEYQAVVEDNLKSNEVPTEQQMYGYTQSFSSMLTQEHVPRNGNDLEPGNQIIDQSISDLLTQVRNPGHGLKEIHAPAAPSSCDQSISDLLTQQNSPLLKKEEFLVSAVQSACDQSISDLLTQQNKPILGKKDFLKSTETIDESISDLLTQQHCLTPRKSDIVLPEKIAACDQSISDLLTQQHSPANNRSNITSKPCDGDESISDMLTQQQSRPLIKTENLPLTGQSAYANCSEAVTQSQNTELTHLSADKSISDLPAQDAKLGVPDISFTDMETQPRAIFEEKPPKATVNINELETEIAKKIAEIDTIPPDSGESFSALATQVRNQAFLEADTEPSDKLSPDIPQKPIELQKPAEEKMEESFSDMLTPVRSPLLKPVVENCSEEVNDKIVDIDDDETQFVKSDLELDYGTDEIIDIAEMETQPIPSDFIICGDGTAPIPCDSENIYNADTQIPISNSQIIFETPGDKDGIPDAQGTFIPEMKLFHLDESIINTTSEKGIRVSDSSNSVNGSDHGDQIKPVCTENGDSSGVLEVPVDEKTASVPIGVEQPNDVTSNSPPHVFKKLVGRTQKKNPDKLYEISETVAKTEVDEVPGNNKLTPKGDTVPSSCENLLAEKIAHEMQESGNIEDRIEAMSDRNMYSAMTQEIMRSAIRKSTVNELLETLEDSKRSDAREVSKPSASSNTDDPDSSSIADSQFPITRVAKTIDYSDTEDSAPVVAEDSQFPVPRVTKTLVYSDSEDTSSVVVADGSQFPIARTAKPIVSSDSEENLSMAEKPLTLSNDVNNVISTATASETDSTESKLFDQITAKSPSSSSPEVNQRPKRRKTYSKKLSPEQKQLQTETIVKSSVSQEIDEPVASPLNSKPSPSEAETVKQKSSKAKKQTSLRKSNELSGSFHLHISVDPNETVEKTSPQKIDSKSSTPKSTNSSGSGTPLFTEKPTPKQYFNRKKRSSSSSLMSGPNASSTPLSDMNSKSLVDMEETLPVGLLVENRSKSTSEITAGSSSAITGSQRCKSTPRNIKKFRKASSQEVSTKSSTEPDIPDMIPCSQELPSSQEWDTLELGRGKRKKTRKSFFGDDERIPLFSKFSPLRLSGASPPKKQRSLSPVNKSGNETSPGKSGSTTKPDEPPANSTLGNRLERPRKQSFMSCDADEVKKATLSDHDSSSSPSRRVSKKEPSEEEIIQPVNVKKFKRTSSIKQGIVDSIKPVPDVQENLTSSSNEKEVASVEKKTTVKSKPKTVPPVKTDTMKTSPVNLRSTRSYKQAGKHSLEASLRKSSPVPAPAVIDNKTDATANTSAQSASKPTADTFQKENISSPNIDISPPEPSRKGRKRSASDANHAENVQVDNVSPRASKRRKSPVVPESSEASSPIVVSTPLSPGSKNSIFPKVTKTDALNAGTDRRTRKRSACESNGALPLQESAATVEETSRASETAVQPEEVPSFKGKSRKAMKPSAAVQKSSGALQVCVSEPTEQTPALRRGRRRLVIPPEETTPNASDTVPVAEVSGSNSRASKRSAKETIQVCIPSVKKSVQEKSNGTEEAPVPSLPKEPAAKVKSQKAAQPTRAASLRRSKAVEATSSSPAAETDSDSTLARRTRRKTDQESPGSTDVVPKLAPSLRASSRGKRGKESSKPESSLSSEQLENLSANLCNVPAASTPKNRIRRARSLRNGSDSGVEEICDSQDSQLSDGRRSQRLRKQKQPFDDLVLQKEEELKGKKSTAKSPGVPSSSNISRSVSELSIALSNVSSCEGSALLSAQSGSLSASLSCASSTAARRSSSRTSNASSNINPRDTKSLPAASFARPSSSADQTHHVMFTSHIEDSKLRAIVKKFGGKVVRKPSDCTVLVTDKVRRTANFLSVLALGKPIVSANWLFKTKAFNKFADPYECLLKDTDNEQTYNFSLTDSLAKAQSSQLLKDYTVYVTPSVLPPPKEMQQIIECSGGVFKTRFPSAWPPKAVVISSPNDSTSWRHLTKNGVTPPIFSAEAILSGVLRQEFDTSKHRLH